MGGRADYRREEAMVTVVGVDVLDSRQGNFLYRNGIFGLPYKSGQAEAVEALSTGIGFRSRNTGRRYMQ